MFLKFEGILRLNMRLEATVPDIRGEALDELAHQLGLNRSQVIDEALVLFLKAVMEVRRGRRIVSVGKEGGDVACEIATASLVTLEWSQHRERIKVSADAMERAAQLIESPPEPTPALRRAVDRTRK
jgi:hypothetical protein